MNLVFLYGPPAVGKTTVGGELAKQTGYRFFYNHLTVPAAKAIFPDARGPLYDTRYTQLLNRLRLDGLQAAADAGLSTIFTLAYSGEVDNKFVSRIADTFTLKGGNVYFVELHAPADTLLQRVSNPQRAALGLGKMTDPAHLQEVLAGRDMYASVPYPDILKIDTGDVTASDAVQHIIRHWGLANVS